MAKKRTQKKRSKKSKNSKSNEKNFGINIIGGLLVVISILAILKLGIVGSFLTNIYRMIVGDSYYILAVLMIIIGTLIFAFGKFPKMPIKRTAGIILAYASLTVFMHSIWFSKMNLHNDIVRISWNAVVQDLTHNVTNDPLGGGMLGAIFYNIMHSLFAQIGTYLINSILMITAWLMIFNVKFNQVVEYFQKLIKDVQKMFKGMNLKTSSISERFFDTDDEKDVDKPEPQKKKAFEDINIFAADNNDEPEKKSDFKIDSYQPDVKEKSEDLVEKEVKDTDIPDSLNNKAPVIDSSDYKLPPISLLSQVEVVDQSSEFKKIEENKDKLQQTFKSFGVSVEVKKATLGPTVTKYEVQPAVGVKVSKIVNLSDDLALALAAKDIRIEAPIPGKPFVGIEVPNQKGAVVGFRDVTEHQQDKSNPMEVPLGKAVTGEVISSDISKMPHLLIAGSTGSGKSVAINTIITGILMKAKPSEVKLILIDPKMVELNIYNGIPHMLIPVVTDAKRATGALQKAVSEMERRYKLFAETSNRNITEYNQKVDEHNEKEPDKPMERLPYIVLIVDELSDLMMTAGREVEAAIVRLAQMARAAGMHIIIATQRPSVDVITGLIKANIPSRIAFAVSSGIDSRTILDSNGAEKLLGRGDMLYQPIGKNKPTRIQGAYISESDVENIVNFVSEQQPAQYDESMIPSDEPETQDSEKEDSKDSLDEYWFEALDLIIHQQSASVSMLQRRFQIGYNRAARMVDLMEEKGLVGPSEGSKGRKVLISIEELEKLKNNN